MKSILIVAALLFAIPICSFADVGLKGKTKSVADTSRNKDVEPPKSDFFIGAGININQISPVSASNYYGAGGRAYTSYLPEVSFGLDVFANPNKEKLVFRLEGSLAQSQYRYSYMNQVYPYVPFKASFDEIAFTITPQVIINFYDADNLKIFGGLGATISFFKYSNDSYGPQQPNAAYQGTSDNSYSFNGFDSGLVVRAGVKFGKRWAIFGNYFSNVGTTQAGYFYLISSCKQVGLNYFFY